MKAVVPGPDPGQAVFVGVDVSRATWAFNVRWGGQERRRWSSPGELSHALALVTQYAAVPLHVAYEASGFGYEIAWALRERGVQVTVVAPSTIARAPGLRVKTDRVDARLLAEQLEQGRLKAVHIPTRADHERRQLSRAYDQAVQDRKRAQARVRALLQEHGRLGPGPRAGWTAYTTWLAAHTLPGPVRLCVDELLASRQHAQHRAQRLQRALLETAAEPAYAPVVQALSAQPGIGSLTAIRLRLELGDMRRFHTAGSFAHYLGLTPAEYSSGERVQRGHLLKCGPGAVRGWLVQCAWASVRGRHADERLREVFERLRSRAGAKRAIIAVTRRLALRVRARWLAGEQTSLPHAA
jgi:transposase